MSDSFPARIRIALTRSRSTGIFAAESPELPGLMTVGHDIEEIEQRLPDAIKQLIKAEYGVDVEVEAIETGGDVDFAPLATPRVVELRAA